MEYHLAHKNSGQGVALQGRAHFSVHLPVNEVHPPLVEPQVHLGIGELITGAKRLLHPADALGLLLDDALGDAPDKAVFGEPQDVVGHLNGRFVVGDHLHDEIVGNALVESGGGHALNHLVQDLVKAA